MGKNAFYDPATGVMVCWGYVESNNPGDIKLPVTEDFALKPGEHKWDGKKFVPYTKPVVVDPKETANAALKALDPKTAKVEDVLTLLKTIL